MVYRYQRSCLTNNPQKEKELSYQLLDKTAFPHLRTCFASWPGGRRAGGVKIVPSTTPYPSLKPKTFTEIPHSLFFEKFLI